MSGWGKVEMSSARKRRVWREELQQLSKTELIEIILRQQAAIRQQHVLIEQLQGGVAQLEEQIKFLTQPPRSMGFSWLASVQAAPAV